MSADDTSTPGRAWGLLVRHWACNMTKVHDQGAIWPGFGYTLAEQAELRAIARRVPSFEFMVWMALVVCFALLIFAGLTLFGTWLLGAIGGGHADSGAFFLVNIGVEIVASLGLGFPAAMLLGSVITGRLCGVADADLPEAPVCAHYVHKLSWQFCRAALWMGALIVAACLWLPDRVWLLGRVVVPVLAPVVSIATLFWYAHRPRGGDQGTVEETRDSTSSST